MKRMIIMAAMAAFTLATQAQIVSSRSTMSTRRVITEPHAGWKTFGAEYLPSKFCTSYEDLSFSGFALNYTHATSITRSIPLFVEWGIGAQYSLYSEDEYKTQFVSLKAPINLIYDFHLPDTKVYLDPYIGFNFRGNIWGEDKYGHESKNLFSSDEANWKRFQVGLHAGLKARFNDSFFIGLGYGLDINNIGEDVQIEEFSISAGIVF